MRCLQQGAAGGAESWQGGEDHIDWGSYPTIPGPLRGSRIELMGSVSLDGGKNDTFVFINL